MGKGNRRGQPLVGSNWTEGCSQAFGVLRPTMVLSAKVQSKKGAVSSRALSNLWTFGHPFVLQALTGSAGDSGPSLSVCPAPVTA